MSVYGFRQKKSFQYKCKSEDAYIFSKDKVALSGITIENKLTFEADIENLCKKIIHVMGLTKNKKISHNNASRSSFFILCKWSV